ATCDDQMTVFINGKEVVSSDRWQTPVFKDVTEYFLQPGRPRGGGRHVVAVRARNNTGSAGLLVRLVFDAPAIGGSALVTDATWPVSGRQRGAGLVLAFDDKPWSSATVAGRLGGPPWTAITEATLAAAARLREPAATPAEQLKVAKDFKVELLYSVPKEK